MTDGISGFQLKKTELPGVPMVTDEKESSSPPVAAVQKLNERETLLLSYVEQVFWETGQIPSHEITVRATDLTLQEVQKTWEEPYFRYHLVQRGIDLTPTTQFRKFLTPRQLALANALLDTHDQRSVREKLKELSISTPTYNSWMRQEAFRAYLSKRVEATFQNTSTTAKQRLSELVDQKDLGAIKFYLEMVGEYNPKLQVDININTVMVKVVEVIATHIKDPIVLEAIATDLEAINAEN